MARRSSLQSRTTSVSSRRLSVMRKPSGLKRSEEKFPPPDMEVLGEPTETFLIKAVLSNDFATVCGAFDNKDHPLAVYIVEQDLFNRRDEYGKTIFDLAAYLGHRDFIRTMLDRVNDKLDEQAFNLRQQMKPTNDYNFMHYACIWNQVELVKLLVNHTKLFVDPCVEEDEAATGAAAADAKKAQANLAQNPNARTLGSILLRSRAKTGETPLKLAKRYELEELTLLLTTAEKRQTFVDNVTTLKVTLADPEKQSKFSKDEKKKLDKLLADTLDWLAGFKELSDAEQLNAKLEEVHTEINPILEKIEIVFDGTNSLLSGLTSGSSSVQSGSQIQSRQRSSQSTKTRTYSPIAED